VSKRSQRRRTGITDAEVLAARLPSAVSTSHRQSRGAHGAKGYVAAVGTEGRAFRCDRCGTVTHASAKATGSACKVTRGCHGHLKPVRA
jgi:hypothetical protein